VHSVRRKLVVTSIVVALGTSIVAPNVTATSAEPDSRAAYFDRYQSLEEYASKGGRDPDVWMPSTRIARKSWDTSVADESVRVDRLGRVLVIEPQHSEIEPDHSESAPNAGSPQLATPAAEIPLSEAFELHSLPGANRTIYLDFTGHSLAGTIWQDQNTTDTSDDYTNEQMLMPAYSDDGDRTTFSNADRQVIIDTWSAVAEDYAAFAVNVTTEEPAQSAIDRTDSNDQIYGARAVITDSANTIAASCGCGGIAYVGVFDYAGFNTYLGPSLSFGDPGRSGKFLSDIVSHEVGHNVGLSHDGTQSLGYYGGRDGWAPIMGVGYYEPLVQFSNGSYTGGNENEDDYAVATATGLPLRADDHGDTRATSTALTLGTADEGFITTRADVDYFAFTATASSHDVSVTLPSVSPNLDVQLKVFNSSGTLISTTNPNLFRSSTEVATGLDASLTATTTPGSLYYLEVDGVGYGSGAETGYSDYGSRGEYRVLVSGAPLLTLSQGTPTISGTGVFGTSLSGATGTWTEGASLSSEWYRNGVATGDTDSTYDILASDVGKTITYRTTGTKDGYSSATATSSGVTVTAATLPSTGTPSISGTGAVGTSLTGSTGDWPEGVTLSTQWMRNGSSAGDTDSSYTIVGGDLGREMVYRVVASKPGYTSVTANSAGVTVTAGTISPTGTPTISGTAAVGTTLTGSNGTWASGLTYATQWYRNGSSAGDTDSSYTIVGSDLGQTIFFRVVGSRTGYTSVTADSATVTVVEGTISPTATPTITGTATVGKRLTARTTGWMTGLTFSYQWLRNSVPIVGANASTYKLKTADKRKRISVQVTAEKLGYTDVTLTSGLTRAVKR
jgi:hypothetical protein